MSERCRGCGGIIEEHEIVKRCRTCNSAYHYDCYPDICLQCNRAP